MTDTNDTTKEPVDQDKRYYKSKSHLFNKSKHSGGYKQAKKV